MSEQKGEKREERGEESAEPCAGQRPFSKHSGVLFALRSKPLNSIPPKHLDHQDAVLHQPHPLRLKCHCGQHLHARRNQKAAWRMLGNADLVFCEYECHKPRSCRVGNFPSEMAHALCSLTYAACNVTALYSRGRQRLRHAPR